MVKIGQLMTKKSISKAMTEIKVWLDKMGINGLELIMQYDAKINVALIKFKYNNKDYEFRSTNQTNCRLNMHGIARVMEFKVRSHIMGIEDFEKSMKGYLQLPNFTNYKNDEVFEANKSSYDVLEINSLASNDEINKQYKKLCKTYHPDMCNSEELKEKFSEKFTKINTAYNEIKKERGII